MPTRAEHPMANLNFPEFNSWTDSLPVCNQSAVGSSINQIYREDGNRQEAHPYEDFSCHVIFEDEENGAGTFLYEIFDGEEGTQAASFALQRMAAEILLYSSLTPLSTDEEIRGILRQGFITVENEYRESVGDKLAERASVQYEIPEGLTSYEQYQKYPHLVDKLNALNTELACGTTGVVALIHNGKLYVANVGDSRALLCKTDANGVLRVVQLSIDHDLRNEDEILRLYKLGLNTQKIRQGLRLGNQENTRCIGNFLVKGGYKDFEELAMATSEPVIAEPEGHGGIVLGETCSFLLLMSKGVYKSLQEATGCIDSVNKEIAHMTVEQFRIQSTLTGVAQGVVDKIVRIHHDAFMSETGSFISGKREDMTLLVRNFNFPMPNALNSPTNPRVRFNPNVSMAPITAYEESTTENEEIESDIMTNDGARNTQDTTTSSSTDNSDMYRVTNSDEKINAYVDFSEFYKNYNKALQEGKVPPSLQPR